MLRATLTLLLLALPTGAQSSNDTYLPRSREAEEALARGDEVWAGREGDEGARREALEAWHTALEASQPGDAVRLDLSRLAAEPFPSPWRDGGHDATRRSEAVELAVRRRLTQAGEDARRLWRERFEGLASAAAESRDRRALVRAERDHPGTLGAFRAALRLAELHLEEGRTLGARTWLERAAAHLALGAGDQAARDALARRRDLLERLGAANPRTDALADALRGARGLELRHYVPLRFVDGGRPGLARLDGDHVIVQGRGADRGLDLVWEVDASGIARPFEPWKLLDEAGLLYAENRRQPGADWNFQPVAVGNAAILVLGRAEDLRGYDERSNCIARFKPPKGPRAGELEWVLGPSGHWTRDEGYLTPIEHLLGPGLWEFQPAPLLLDDRVIVQARLWKQERDESGRLRLAARGEARAFAVALDQRDGSLLWKRELGRGAEPRARVDIPMAATRRIRTPAAAPVAVGGHRVFCGTQLGVGALLDAADGRVLWTYLNPRRSADDQGWSALPAPRVVPGEPPTIVWAPADGDRLHWMRGDVDLAGDGLSRHPTFARDESEALLGADANGALILTRFGPNVTLASYRPATGERLDAIDLGRGETPLYDLLASPTRALFATNRALYLFDRERELYLLEALPLPPAGGPPTGRLLVHRGAVQLLTPYGLWTFAVVRGARADAARER